jgi:amicyanin
MIMRKVLVLIALLMFLVACRSQQPSQPIQPVVQAGPVQVISQPSEKIEQIEIKPSVNTGTVNVDIRDFSFQPAEVKVKVGDTVVWTQRDKVQHNVEIVSGPESFKSELLELGKTFSYTFTKPGEYSYKCTPHPKMRGKIIVE